eukprot:11204060-Alexandrium_andersonii.AAC.1
MSVAIQRFVFLNQWALGPILFAPLRPRPCRPADPPDLARPPLGHWPFPPGSPPRGPSDDSALHSNR